MATNAALPDVPQKHLHINADTLTPDAATAPRAFLLPATRGTGSSTSTACGHTEHAYVTPTSADSIAHGASASILRTQSCPHPTPITPRPGLVRALSSPGTVAPAPALLLRDALDALPAGGRAELSRHMTMRGVVPTQDMTLAQAYAALADAEFAAIPADRRHPLVTPALMHTACARAHKAKGMIPAPLKVLSGWNNLLDGKVTLTPEVLEALATAAVAQTQGGQEELLRAIHDGPGDDHVTWSAITTPIQLVASLARQLALGGGSSLQIRLSTEMATWLHDTLQAQHIPVAYAMGGAGAFCANIVGALPPMTAHFYVSNESSPGARRGTIAAPIARKFGDTVHAVTSDGTVTPAEHAGNPDQHARINYVVEYAAHDPAKPMTVLGHATLPMGKRDCALQPPSGSRVILSSPTLPSDGFHPVNPDVTARIAQQHDVLFLSGMHYFTAASPDACEQQAKQLADVLRAMKGANESLLRHWLYVVAKTPHHEPLLVQHVIATHPDNVTHPEHKSAAFDSMSLNTVEMPEFLARNFPPHAPKLPDPVTHPEAYKVAIESPDVVVHSLNALRHLTGIPRIQAHGKSGDFVLIHLPPSAQHSEVSIAALANQQILACLRARQLGSMKAANPGGEIIDAKSDIWDLAPTVDGPSLAMLPAFADAVTALFGTDTARAATDRKAIVNAWYHWSPHTRDLIVFVPGRSIHALDGGTVGLGDTFDLLGLLFSPRPVV